VAKIGSGLRSAGTINIRDSESFTLLEVQKTCSLIRGRRIFFTKYNVQGTCSLKKVLQILRPLRISKLGELNGLLVFTAVNRIRGGNDAGGKFGKGHLFENGKKRWVMIEFSGKCKDRACKKEFFFFFFCCKRGSIESILALYRLITCWNSEVKRIKVLIVIIQLRAKAHFTYKEYIEGDRK
jgi:hypothetical protein